MNKLIDAFRVVVEPLRFMIAKNSRRIEELAQTPIEDILPSTVPVMPSAPTASDSGKIPMVQSDGSWGLVEALVINSSTAGSTKKFRLTVDDDGLITAQEIT